jgi:esterase/lipase superfamily enzyme
VVRRVLPEADTTVIAFTWPSGGELFGNLPNPPDAAYRHDQDMAGRSSAHLASFLANVLTLVSQTRRAGKRAFLLAHSMGNHALEAAIASGVAPGGVTYNEAILAAADEIYDTFDFPEPGRLSGLRRLGKRTSIYFSSADAVLGLSMAINLGAKRLGQEGPHDRFNAVKFPPALYRMVDCSHFTDFEFGFASSHQYYRRSPSVRADIAQLMASPMG